MMIGRFRVLLRAVEVKGCKLLAATLVTRVEVEVNRDVVELRCRRRIHLAHF